MPSLRASWMTSANEWRWPLLQHTCVKKPRDDNATLQQQCTRAHTHMHHSERHVAQRNLLPSPDSKTSVCCFRSGPVPSLVQPNMHARVIIRVLICVIIRVIVRYYMCYCMCYYVCYYMCYCMCYCMYYYMCYYVLLYVLSYVLLSHRTRRAACEGVAPTCGWYPAARTRV